MKRILDIGQCDRDHPMMQKLAALAHADIVRAHTAQDALEKLQTSTFDLVLVNRMLDADNTYGVEIIKKLKLDPQRSHVPVMLISNFAEAQTDAQRLGAIQGFGKDHLNDPETLKRVVAALG